MDPSNLLKLLALRAEFQPSEIPITNPHEYPEDWQSEEKCYHHYLPRELINYLSENPHSGPPHKQAYHGYVSLEFHREATELGPGLAEGGFPRLLARLDNSYDSAKQLYCHDDFAMVKKFLNNGFNDQYFWHGVIYSNATSLALGLLRHWGEPARERVLRHAPIEFLRAIRRHGYQLPERAYEIALGRDKVEILDWIISQGHLLIPFKQDQIFTFKLAVVKHLIRKVKEGLVRYQECGVEYLELISKLVAERNITYSFALYPGAYQPSGSVNVSSIHAPIMSYYTDVTLGNARNAPNFHYTGNAPGPYLTYRPL